MGKTKRIGLRAAYILFFQGGIVSGGLEETPRGKEIEDLKARVRCLEQNSKADVSLHGVLVGNFQSLSVANTPTAGENVSQGVFVFQPEVTVRGSPRGEFFFKFGFAAGNGVAAQSPFVLSPWVADAEDDLRDINGRDRDALLNAYYTHAISFPTARLDVTGGVIDATDFIDENAFSNDEFSQFMNERETVKGWVSSFMLSSEF